ncbi:MAG TPA: hypothetical protein VE684_01970 [Crenalkalicoccus sp.]|nr:hypothetical protein [Crenalkalicoccus sp.]
MRGRLGLTERWRDGLTGLLVLTYVGSFLVTVVGAFLVAVEFTLAKLIY